MSAQSSIATYTHQAICGAIRSLSFQDRKWASRLEELLIEKVRREREERESSEPSQYQHHRGCPP